MVKFNTYMIFSHFIRFCFFINSERSSIKPLLMYLRNIITSIGGYSKYNCFACVLIPTITFPINYIRPTTDNLTCFYLLCHYLCYILQIAVSRM